MGLGIKDVKINFWSNTAICEDIGYMIYQPTTTKIQIQIQIQIQLKKPSVHWQNRRRPGVAWRG